MACIAPLGFPAKRPVRHTVVARNVTWSWAGKVLQLHGECITNTRWYNHWSSARPPLLSTQGRSKFHEIICDLPFHGEFHFINPEIFWYRMTTTLILWRINYTKIVGLPQWSRHFFIVNGWGRPAGPSFSLHNMIRQLSTQVRRHYRTSARRTAREVDGNSFLFFSTSTRNSDWLGVQHTWTYCKTARAQNWRHFQKKTWTKPRSSPYNAQTIRGVRSRIYLARSKFELNLSRIKPAFTFQKDNHGHDVSSHENTKQWKLLRKSRV